MTRRFDRDRRRIAYLFALTTSSVAVYSSWKGTLDYGAFLALGALCTAVFVLLGLPADPRKYYDDPRNDRRAENSLKQAPIVERRNSGNHERMAGIISYSRLGVPG